jgi:hypothetical protein
LKSISKNKALHLGENLQALKAAVFYLKSRFNKEITLGQIAGEPCPSSFPFQKRIREASVPCQQAKSAERSGGGTDMPGKCSNRMERHIFFYQPV